MLFVLLVLRQRLPCSLLAYTSCPGVLLGPAAQCTFFLCCDIMVSASWVTALSASTELQLEDGWGPVQHPPPLTVILDLLHALLIPLSGTAPGINTQPSLLLWLYLCYFRWCLICGLLPCLQRVMPACRTPPRM
jgi:hypothetical protein